MAKPDGVDQAPLLGGLLRAPPVARAAELVLGAACASCGCPSLGPCDRCLAVLAAVRPFAVTVATDALPPVVASGPYADELRRLLLAAKERGALGLVPLLGDRLAIAVAAWLLDEGIGVPVVLAPVPTARSRVAERGLDLPLALVRVAARRLAATGLPVSVWRGLRLARRPRDQSQLGLEGRLANLAGAMRVVRPVPAGRLVVADDIVTTGATLAEAVRACRAAGAAPAAAVAVAATPRRRGAR